jgi:TetR/AcrR family transcriptional regulator, fatty acid biosynthesis regulator
MGVFTDRRGVQVGDDTTGSRGGGKRLRRAEMKELTRRRLMTSAMELLDEQGGSKLSVSAIARRAGIAQSTFYVHFDDLGQLLRELGEELAVHRGIAVRDARRRVRETPDAQGVRETFRIPLEEMTSRPEWYRMWLRARFDPESPLGDVVREMLDRERRDLVDDLILAGFPSNTTIEHRSAEMVADCLAAMTESLARGQIEGRYPSNEEILDVLVRIFDGGIMSFFSTGE